MCHWDSQRDLMFPQDSKHQEDKHPPLLWNSDWGVVCSHPAHRSIQGHSFQICYLEMFQLLLHYRTSQRDRVDIPLHEQGPAKRITSSVNAGNDKNLREFIVSNRFLKEFSISQFAHLEKFSLNFCKFVICNPCQPSPSLFLNSLKAILCIAKYREWPL